MNEELTPSQLDELHLRLQVLKQELETLLNSTVEGARPVGLDQPIGRLSRMDALQQQSMAQASRRGCQLRLQQVCGALLAVKSDKYGWCRECEEPIGYPRLSARPESPYCLECQNRRESGR